MLQVVELLLNAVFDVEKLLRKRDADPNTVTKLSSTSFLLACEICDLDIIEAGADFNYAASGLEADNLNITDQTAFFCGYIKQSY
ncbi:unnamed protein product [Rotaria sordida]|uniref:Uncharacterized protein n=1 Tax=Rotaria sordida TaxID=392033 RepID=A0A816C8X1_9BILA|nr:unnamed protein product [Rotaria sordida]CAF1621205.1 unnamed protein product [Rotaria sordida]